jgi:sirohydrochlorin cobaltochelatase
VQVERLQKQYPQIAFSAGSYFGFDQGIFDLLDARVAGREPPDRGSAGMRRLQVPPGGRAEHLHDHSHTLIVDGGHGHADAEHDHAHAHAHGHDDHQHAPI